MLVGVFSVMQALPSQLANPVLKPVRAPAIVTMLLNVCWLYLFSYERYWLSLVVIASYAATLLYCLDALDMHYITGDHPWQTKLYACAFSANSAWVCVATGLQVCVNMLDEGWGVSADFTIGLLGVVVAFACYNVFIRADFMYAFVSAWALGGIISNQKEGSTWGCLSKICSQQCMDKMHICSTGPASLSANTTSYELPGMFGESCAKFQADKQDICLVKSSTVVSWCYVFIIIVLLTLAKAVVLACYTKQSGGGSEDEKKAYSNPTTEMGVGEATDA